MKRALTTSPAPAMAAVCDGRSTLIRERVLVYTLATLMSRLNYPSACLCALSQDQPVARNWLL